MHHRKTYMHINFQQNWVRSSVKTVHTNLFAKKCKLHKFVSCNKNFEKSRLSDMHHPLRDIQADFEMNRPTTIKLPQKEIIDTNGLADRR